LGGERRQKQDRKKREREDNGKIAKRRGGALDEEMHSNRTLVVIE